MKSYYKPYSIVLIIVIIINGCTPDSVPLKGKYTGNPTEFTSTKSSDSLWLNIRQIFSEKGLVIKKIDTEKGLIVTKKTPFISVYSQEDKDGKLVEPQAWVVLQKEFTKKKEWDPKTIYGEWRIQINETESGVTKIKIDPIVICTYYPNMFTSMEARGQSTGKLEHLIDSTLLKNVKKVSKN
jgi:hypothetical protein